jgi:hypothetical protein
VRRAGVCCGCDVIGLGPRTAADVGAKRRFTTSNGHVNVIRDWLGHASLNTTNRYAEITMPMKTEAMKLCAPEGSDTPSSRQAPWQDDASLLQ